MSNIAAVPTVQMVERVVELANRAPSVHNTQPWRWRFAGGQTHVLDLHADRSRQLAAEDPEGRNLVISCGAALHHAQVAARAMGWSTEVERVPGGTDPTLLARLHLTPSAPPDDAVELVRAIERRRTDRRRFTTWPVPDAALSHLAGAAGAWAVRAVPLVDVTDRLRTELLVHRAIERQQADARRVREQAQWVNHGAEDGIPYAALAEPQQLEVRRPDRFSVGLLDESGDRDVEPADGLIVLCSTEDEPASWLRAGEGLSALWLRATVEGLSVVPLSQVVEVLETRLALQHEVLGGLARPLLLVRAGWQPISRSELPRTSRRPVGDVLELS